MTDLLERTDTVQAVVSEKINGNGNGASANVINAAAGIGPSGYDVQRVRAEFPILRETVHGKPLVYLDNAATTQKPQAVIAALAGYYEHDNANVHRGVHLLSERVTKRYEAARVKVQKFLGAAKSEEIIYTRNATEAINLVAATYGRKNLRDGDEIVISHMEHHSNIVPWQMLSTLR